MKKLLLIICLVLLALPCFAATYYVAETENGDGDGSSYANRMSVTTHNASTFVGGDLIYLCGTITTQIVAPSSGSGFATPITYSGYEEYPATLTREGTQFVFSNKSHLRFDQITFDGDGNNGTVGLSSQPSAANTPTTGITITRCTFQDFRSDTSREKNTAIFMESDWDTSRFSYVTIGGSDDMGNTFRRIGVDTGDGDVLIARGDDIIHSYNDHEGDTVSPFESGIDGITLLQSTNILIEYNRFYSYRKATPSGSVLYHRNEYGEDGIDLKSSDDIIVRYNYFGHIHAYGININTDNSMSTPTVCSNIVIYGNLIEDTRTAILARNNADGVYAFSNVISRTTTGYGINIVVSGASYFYNNTIVNAHGAGGAHSIWHESGPATFGNNIVYSDSYSVLARVWQPAVTAGSSWDTNAYYYYPGSIDTPTIRWVDSFYNQSSPGFPDSYPVVTYPVFQSVEDDQLWLAATAPAIAGGNTLAGTLPSFSIQGVAHGAAYSTGIAYDSDFKAVPPEVYPINRNNYNAGVLDTGNGVWDLGAYVYGVEGGDGIPTPPTPPITGPYDGPPIINFVTSPIVNWQAASIVNKIYWEAAPAGPTCEAATDTVGGDFIGIRTSEFDNTQQLHGDVLYCQLHTPSCSGDLDTAYAYIRQDNSYTSSNDIKVLVYSTTDSDEDSTPTNGTLIGTSAALNTTSGGLLWKNGAVSGASLGVLTTNDYWVCVVAESYGIRIARRDGAEYVNRWSKGFTDSYDTPPASLTASDWAESTRQITAFVGIGD